jgi:MFS transporter, DHA3 family, macrolide efflux protein
MESRRPVAPARPTLGREVNHVVLARLISSTGAEGAFLLGLWGKAAFVFDGTPTDLAIMSALVGLAAMVGSVAGGVAVDRFDARRVVLASEALFVPATLAMVLATDIPRLLVFGIVSWLAGAALETAIVSLPPVLAPPARLEQANARLESANWIALIAGPAIAAPLVARYGVDSVFVFDALTSVAALVLIVRIRLPAREAPEDTAAGEVAPGDASGSGLRDTVEGLRYAMATPPVRTALYLGALPGLAFGMFVALEPLFFRDVVGTSVEVLGYVNAVFGVGLLAGSVAVERAGARLATFRALIWLTAASGLGGILYVATPTLAIVLVGAVVWSVPLGMQLPLMRTLAQRHAEPRFVGRVMGAIGTVTAGISILPVIAAPALAARLGVQAVLVASAAVAVVAAPLIWRAATRLDAQYPPVGIDAVGAPPPTHTTPPTGKVPPC